MSMNPATLAAQIEAIESNIAHARLQPIMVVGPVCQVFSGDRKTSILTDSNYPGITIRSSPAYGAHSYQVRNYAFVGPNRGVLLQGEVLAGTDQSQYFATFDALTFTGVGNGWEANIPVWGSRFDNLIFNEGATFRGISRGGASKANTFGNIVFMAANLIPEVENAVHMSAWQASIQMLDFEDVAGTVLYADGGSHLEIEMMMIERYASAGRPIMQVEGEVRIRCLGISSLSGPVRLFESIGSGGRLSVECLRLDKTAVLSNDDFMMLKKGGTEVIIK